MCRTWKAGNKGQISTLDLIVAILIFLSVIFMVLWARAEVTTNIWEYEGLEDYRDANLDLLDILLKTSGSPTDWESLNMSNASNYDLVNSIGFVSEPSVIEPEKLAAFNQIPYNESRRMLGLGKEGFYIEISKGARTIAEFGRDEGAISAFERPAILGNDTVILTLRLFRE